ncbi:MAG: hypothetical protein IPK82_38515 [Polyangiaceae bacterium]|nr:hypothetical protein [Polyangiaceae bacterium]
MKIPAAWAASVVLLSALWAGSARAFSDPALFGAPATVGGGAGRHFTGSPADGHGCGVCHGGGAPPVILLDGFPEVTQPGARYDATLRWTSPELSHALHLELMNAAGEHPDIELSNDGALPAEERCEGVPDGAPAVYAVDIGPRRVLGVQDCGARSLSFSFVAPEGPLTLALGVVRSDQSATPDGDGVLEHRRVIPSSAETAGSCAVCGPPHGGEAWVAGLGALILISARRRARRLRPRRSAE